MEATQSAPAKLDGKQLEAAIVAVNGIYRANGYASIGRYGVQAVGRPHDWTIMQSLPDFEGDIMPGVSHGVGGHVIFDAKSCSQSSFGLSKYRDETKGSKRRQLNHMLDRSQYGATCFFLIHWNERMLKTKSDPPSTWKFPVAANWFWNDFLDGGVRSITRDACEEYGTQVEWRTQPGGRTLRPDYLGMLT